MCEVSNGTSWPRTLTETRVRRVAQPSWLVVISSNDTRDASEINSLGHPLRLTSNRQRLCELEGQAPLHTKSDVLLAGSVGYGGSAAATDETTDQRPGPARR